MVVLCKKNSTFENYDRQKFSGDRLTFEDPWFPISPKVQVLKLPLPLPRRQTPMTAVAERTDCLLVSK